MIFFDRILIDLKRLYATTVKVNSSKTASLFLALTLKGEIIKPLCIMSSDILYTGLYEYAVILYAYTNNGLVEEKNILDWFQCALSKFDVGYFVSQEYDFLFGKDFLRCLKERDIKLVIFPRGVSCLLNPFKDITPMVIKYLNIEARKILRLEEVKNDAFLAWISYCLGKFFNEHPNLPFTAFKTLLG